MVVHLLPERICGEDTDDLFAYSTPKVAYIRDRYVGALYYLLIIVAMGWVFVGQILWRNEHFMLKDVKGISRMLISHPTLNQCDANAADCMADFKSLSELPYCNQHAGGAKVDHPADCKFADKHSLFEDGTVGSQVFIPTSQVIMEEQKDCQPSSKNDYSCENEYRKKSWGGDGYYFNETNMEFFANVEDFTVQFTSTYHREGIAGTSLDHPGFYAKCFDERDETEDLSWKERLDMRKKVCKDERTVPIECMPGMECQKGGLKTIEDLKRETGKNLGRGKLVDSKKLGLQDKEPDGLDQYEPGDDDTFVQLAGVRTSKTSLRARRLQADTHVAQHEPVKYRPTPEVFASTWGDTFKIGKLMELANLDLDRHYNMDGMSARMAGSIIEVEATYTNLRKFLSSFGLSQVQYTYRVKERKLPYVSREALHPEQPPDYPKRRRYIVQHGILLDYKVGGEFGFFSIVYLLIMLTTSLALLATAHKVTDLTALYLHPRRNNYFHQKYDVSPDFSDMWRCDKCGFYNTQKDKTCRGLDKWMCAQETEPCGNPRKEESNRKD